MRIVKEGTTVSKTGKESGRRVTESQHWPAEIMARESRYIGFSMLYRDSRSQESGGI
jgi:hypothetical protein